jgi:hypothetical protein
MRFRDIKLFNQTLLVRQA